MIMPEEFWGCNKKYQEMFNKKVEGEYIINKKNLLAHIKSRFFA